MSMTGFARLTKKTDAAQFTIELKSVNHRYCEVECYLPDIFSQLELPWRNLLKEKLSRGKIHCGLRIQWQGQAQQGLPLDEHLLSRLLGAIENLTQKSPHVGKTSPIDLLKWPGVINPELLNLESLQKTLTETLHDAVQALIDSRLEEGKHIKLFMLARLNTLKNFTGEIRTALPQLLDAQQQRILKKFDDARIQLDPDRLAQEMVLFAQRTDVAEELGRLEIHLNAVKNLLDQPNTAGRKLDFMMQELNRETNTLGSKSFSADITQKVVAMKVCIEEMREQIQNIE